MYYLFTDGSCYNNGKKNASGGYGVYYPKNPELNLSVKLTGNVTNNIGELSAMLKGLLNLIQNVDLQNQQIIIVSDSKYCIDSLSKWAIKWEKNNWVKSDKKPVKNLEIIKPLYYLVKNLKVQFKHINSHKDPPEKTSPEYFFWEGNYFADKLANGEEIVKSP